MTVHSDSEKPRAKHSPHVAQPLEAADNPDALLQLATASAIAGLGQSTLRKIEKADPTFPKFIKLGSRCTRIRAGDLTDWLKAQAAKASAPATPAQQGPVVVSITPAVKRGSGRPRKETA